MILGILDWLLAWGPLMLIPFNLSWYVFTRNMRRAVPGSLQEAHWRGRCRAVRYPGALLWPALAVANGSALAPSEDPTPLWAAPFFVLLVLWCIGNARSDWRELRRQIEEDEDDPWNRGKKLLKRARRAARNATTIRVPQVAPARF